MLEKLDGYKTYVMAAAVGLLGAAKFLGWIDAETFTALVAVFGGGGIASLRAGVKKAES